MTPAAAIALLDRALVANGQTVTLKHRVAGQPEVLVSVRATLRGYRAEEVTDDIMQDDRKAVLSPSGLPFTPTRLDKIVVQGSECSVQAVDRIMVADAVVRIEIQVRG